MKLKRSLLLLLAATLLSCGIGNGTSSDLSLSDTATESLSQQSCAVRRIDVPEAYPRYESARVFVGTYEIPVANVKVNDSHVYRNPEPSRVDSGIARCYIRGKVTFRIETDYALYQVATVYPSAYQIVPFTDAERRTISFEIYNPGQYVIEPNGDPLKAIHLFVYALEESEYDDYVAPLLAEGYELIRLPSGILDRSNCSLIGADDCITLRSKTILWFDDETVLRAKIAAYNASDIHIIGRGIIDGSAFLRQDVVVPINFEKCSGISLNHITVLDPAAWTCNFYFTDSSQIRDIAIISSRANGDGITLQSCHDIVVDSCFVRGFDDNLVVKNYAYPYGNSDRSTHGSSYNIRFENCILWNDLAQAMEIGYETCGDEIRDIAFENIDVIHAFHKPVISIHNSNYAEVHDISYRNITVEHAAMGEGDAAGNDELIDFKSCYSALYTPLAGGGETEIGNIRNVTIENVRVRSAKDRLNLKITLQGQKDTRSKYAGTVSSVSDITLKNLQFPTGFLTGEYPYIERNSYVQNVQIQSDSTEVKGFQFQRYWSAEFLESLSKEVIFL